MGAESAVAAAGAAADTPARLKLTHPAGSPPPLAVVGAAALAVVPLELAPVQPGAAAKQGDGVVLSFGDRSEQVVGATTCLRYFGRVAQSNGGFTLRNFYGGGDALLAAKVDEWLELLAATPIATEFERLGVYLDEYLQLRTFLVGHSLSLADIAVWAALFGTGPRWENMRRASTPKWPNVTRWFNAVASTVPTLHAALSPLVPSKRGPPASSSDGQKGSAAEGKKEKQGKDGGGASGGGGKASALGGAAAGGGGGGGDQPADLDLPGAVYGKVVTRFPPEPSGYMHIGHAKAALMNQFFAEKYGGRLLIRFDDTNPSKEKDEFVESILQDLATLGIKGEKVTHTSDYFDEMLVMAEKLIREGKAYVDDTPQEQMKEERMKCVESVHRNNSIEKNLAMWNEMLAGTETGQKCCLRAKMDMTAKNGTLRDPVYYRCPSNNIPHLRTGNKYKLYPTYDFACPYVDAIEGVTHALRSSEYHDRNEQYYSVLQDMGLPRVEVWDFSRLNFQYTLLSKRKLTWFVDNGRVDGWNDPRFPTVQGIMRRGLTVEALKQFILSQGASKNLNLMEWDKLWTINKRIIDPVCPRHTAVVSEGKVPFVLSDGPEVPFTRIVPKHKKYPPAGVKATAFSRRILLDQEDAAAVREGEEVTLMDWGNAIVEEVVRGGEGEGVTELRGRLHLEGSVKTTKLKLTWLADVDELVPLTLVKLDHLITKKKMEEDDDFMQFLNPVTRTETDAIGDANMRNLQRGDIIQLERKGYYICDAPLVRPTRPIVLISIPDGRQQPAAPPAAAAPAKK